MNSKVRKHYIEALPHLEAGGAFVLRPERMRPLSRNLVLKMRMRLADGSFLPEKWNYAKVKLERLARLKEGKTDEGYRMWRLKCD